MPVMPFLCFVFGTSLSLGPQCHQCPPHKMRERLAGSKMGFFVYPDAILWHSREAPLILMPESHGQPADIDSRAHSLGEFEYKGLGHSRTLVGRKLLGWYCWLLHHCQCINMYNLQLSHFASISPMHPRTNVNQHQSVLLTASSWNYLTIYTIYICKNK